MILPGWRPLTEWVSIERLEQELAACRERGGLLLYSRDDPATDPSEQVLATFARIVSYQLPIKLLEQAHPDALR